MKKVIKSYKMVGETPLQALERTREEENIPREVPMTYAGRLDPAAEGEMLFLTGDECKRKSDYLGLDKEYVIGVLFGIETDTGDTLGLIKKVDTGEGDTVNPQEYTGKYLQKYPTYSSKMLSRKVHMEITTKEIEIYSIKKMNEKRISGYEIALSSLDIVSRVKGNFRQNEIAGEWNAFRGKFKETTFKLIMFNVVCSSGTYMRSLAERMGKDSKIGACASLIKRVRIYL